MKYIILQYNEQNGNILCAMFELSKPFDEINHDGMIDIMIRKASLPYIIVGYKIYWIYCWI